nr:hypothetical protein [Tetragenococcus halophilus]
MVNAGATSLSIQTAKLADFIVLDEGPLEDIKVMQNDKTVFKKGKK